MSEKGEIEPSPEAVALSATVLLQMAMTDIEEGRDEAAIERLSEIKMLLQEAFFNKAAS